MLFSSNIVYSVLCTYRCRSHIRPNADQIFHWVELLPENHSDIRSGMVYVCRLSEALQVNHQDTDCLFVCIYDRYLSDEERDDAALLQRIVIVEENLSISGLLSIIQRRFIELNEWENGLKDILIRGGSYQDIFDLSERYLKNALFALDATYHLIAYGKAYQSEDPIHKQLYENGYYNTASMDKLTSHGGRFGMEALDTSAHFTKPQELFHCESIAEWCSFEGVPLLHIIESFSHHPVSADSMELFELMMKYVKTCFLREQRDNISAPRQYGHFLREIIIGTMTDINQIDSTARNLGIPLTGHFDLYHIAFHSTRRVLIGRFIEEMQALMPGSIMLSIGMEVTAFNSYRNKNIHEQSECNLKKIEPLLKRYDAICGVSASFTKFSGIKHASDQAIGAIRFGRVPIDTDRSEHERIFFRYEESFIYYLIDNNFRSDFDVFENNPYVQLLTELHQYDEENSSNLYALLFTYLKFERRPMEVSDAMHMHRNTVMYHIRRIEEMLHLDLDDYHTRLGLILAYHAFFLKTDELYIEQLAEDYDRNTT